MFKAIILLSTRTETIYSWDGELFTVIKKNSRKKLGETLKGFSSNKVNFKEVFNSTSKEIDFKKSKYLILSRVSYTKAI